MAYLIASSTMAQSAALMAAAAASRDAKGIRRIDQATACAGWGVAAPWLWPCEWSCA